MPVLLPIPATHDLVAPEAQEASVRQWAKDITHDYQRVRAILLQDIERLSRSGSGVNLDDLQREIKRQGLILSILLYNALRSGQRDITPTPFPVPSADFQGLIHDYLGFPLPPVP